MTASTYTRPPTASEDNSEYEDADFEELERTSLAGSMAELLSRHQAQITESARRHERTRRLSAARIATDKRQERRKEIAKKAAETRWAARAKKND